MVLEGLDTDYINANWLQGFKKRHAYIAGRCMRRPAQLTRAGQGPVPESFTHFWYMVWQTNVGPVSTSGAV